MLDQFGGFLYLNAMKKAQDKKIKIPDMSEVPFEDRLRILLGIAPVGVKLVVHEDEEGTTIAVEKVSEEEN